MTHTSFHLDEGGGVTRILDHHSLGWSVTITDNDGSSVTLFGSAGTLRAIGDRLVDHFDGAE